jgi:hypothetical protein
VMILEAERPLIMLGAAANRRGWARHCRTLFAGSAFLFSLRWARAR